MAWWFLFSASCILFYGLYWFLQPIFASLKNRHPLSFEHYFADPATRNKAGKIGHFVFPSIYEAATLSLSVIVPAYNETVRIPPMLVETITALKERNSNDPSFTFEVIVVDDGSTDTTCATVLDFVKAHSADVVRLLKLPYNMGKGGAVQQGVLHARGAQILFADADGASDFACLPKLERELARIARNGLGIAIGSRAHLADDAVAERKWYRNVLMHGLHIMVRLLSGVSDVRDTQCGFKLFTRKAALVLFVNQRLTRWCFDVELLFIAAHQKIPLAEVAINWAEIDGSKMNLMDASLSMGRDLAVIRLAYMLGIWRIEYPDSPGVVAMLPRPTETGDRVDAASAVAALRKAYPISAAAARDKVTKAATATTTASK